MMLAIPQDRFLLLFTFQIEKTMMIGGVNAIWH